jgi:riboflavin kinase/FMN adenylyltransferase
MAHPYKILVCHSTPYEERSLVTKNSIHSIAIGSFDGLHLGHQALISQADMIVAIERNSGYLTPGFKRSLYTDKPITIYHFEKIRSLTPEAFVTKLQNDFPQLQKIIIGYDFHFGRDKAGDGTYLQQIFDGEVIIVGQVTLDGIPVHSRTIKHLLREGDICLANRLLGQPYRIDGAIIRGQGLGAKALVPTLNLNIDHYQLPLEGVYATHTLVNGLWMKSISFLGHRVTTDGSFAVETHILDQEISTPPTDVWIEFEGFIRENKKFNSLDALKIQIDEDIQWAKEILS